MDTKSFQDAMVGSALGSIAQLNERNLRLVKVFLDNQLKIMEEERAESQDSPSFIMTQLEIIDLIEEKKEERRALCKEIHRLQELRREMINENLRKSWK